MTKRKILVLCTGNSARSQMAEGLLKNLAGDVFDVYSAGTNPAGRVRPLAVEVMKEIGIDISDQYPKEIAPFMEYKIDYVITTCDNAKSTCPVFPQETTNIHWGLEDPAEATGTHEERLKQFRRVRDQLKEKIEGFLEKNK